MVGISDRRVATPEYALLEALWQACLRGETCRPETPRGAPAQQALYASLLQAVGVDAPTAIDLIFATTKGDMGTWEYDRTTLLRDAAAHAAALLHLGENNATISAACASGVVALMDAALRVESGTREIIVAGADLASRFVHDGFASFKALCATTCKPFDANRDGLMVGSAAARCRVRHWQAGDSAVAGYASRCDAVHMTAPDRQARGLIAAIHDALTMAQLRPQDVDAIVAHGTGTPYNDAMEATAFAQVFGMHRPAITAIKGTLGHTLGAAGLVEMAVACKMLEEQIVPPIAGLAMPEYPALDLVTGAPRPQPLRVVLKTASGFGGINAAMLLTRQPHPQAANAPALSQNHTNILTLVPGKCAAVDTVAGVRTVVEQTGEASTVPTARDLPPILLEMARMANSLLAHYPPEVRARTGLILGTATGCALEDHRFDASRRPDPRLASPAAFSRTLPTALPTQLGLMLGLRGPTFILSAGEHSAALALFRAHAWMTQLGLPLLLAGGFEQQSDAHFQAALMLIEGKKQPLATARTSSAFRKPAVHAAVTLSELIRLMRDMG